MRKRVRTAHPWAHGIPRPSWMVQASRGQRLSRPDAANHAAASSLPGSPEPGD